MAEGKNRILIGAVMLMGAAIVVQLIVIAGLQQSHSEQEMDFHLYQEGASVRFERMQEDVQNLNDRNYVLMSDLNSTQAQYRDAYEQLQTERGEVEETLRAIDHYHAEMQKRMAWFKANAELGTTPFPGSDPRNAESLGRALSRDCMRIEGNACIISMGCIADLNVERLGIVYKSDEERRVTEKWDTPDRLHSINETLKERGGDCNDYSILVKAEVNRLRAACGAAQPRIDGWSRGPGEYDLAYNTGQYRGEQRGATPHPIAAGYIYPNMVCGTFDGGKSGHCMLAFTASPVRTAADIRHLDYAELIEPQTGEAKGRINDNYNVRMGEQIWVVASDTNLFFYSAKQDEWLDDAGFDQQLLDAKKRLETLSARTAKDMGRP